MGNSFRMVWANSKADVTHTRGQLFLSGNKLSLLVLLTLLVVACSDDKKSKSSGGSEGTANDEPVKKLVPKKKPVTETGAENSPNNPTASSEGPGVGSEERQAQALPAVGIVVSPSSISKTSGPVSCSYNLGTASLPPGAQIQYAWKIGENIAAEWAAPAVELDAHALYQGAALSCGVRGSQRIRLS